MYLPIEKQKEFIKWQIQEHEEAYLSYLSTPMLAHFKYKSAFWGKIWGVDEKRLSLIIRFKRSMAPRINYAMAGFVYGGIPNPEEPEKWDFTYEYFSRSQKPEDNDNRRSYDSSFCSSRPTEQRRILQFGMGRSST